MKVRSGFVNICLVNNRENLIFCPFSPRDECVILVMELSLVST